MKLVSFGPAGSERPGMLVADDRILDLEAASEGQIRSIRSLLAQGVDALARVAALAGRPPEKCLLPLAGVRLGPPVTDPRKIVCLGLNYTCHAAEQKAKVRDQPLLFAKATSSLAGHFDPILRPDGEEHLDYEAELAVVIGRPALRVTPADWEAYVAGYTILNDLSARDAQFADRQWFRGKSFDSFCPLGPWLVTRDEIPDPHALRLSTRLNDELRQDGHTGNMITRIPDIIAYATRNITFLPGDIIATGTPAGVGIFRTPPACMRPGDTVSVTIERIGTLTNRVQ